MRVWHGCWCDDSHTGQQLTIIAWDGKTLAADKRASCGGAHYSVTKIFRTDDGDWLVGLSGEADRMAQARVWFNGVRDPEKWPGDSDGSMYALAVHRSGRIEKYESSGWPIVVEAPTLATGSGFAYATAAMCLGCDAEAAVAVASRFDPGCGNGVDVLTFTPE